MDNSKRNIWKYKWTIWFLPDTGATTFTINPNTLESQTAQNTNTSELVGISNNPKSFSMFHNYNCYFEATVRGLLLYDTFL